MTHQRTPMGALPFRNNEPEMAAAKSHIMVGIVQRQGHLIVDQGMRVRFSLLTLLDR